MENNELKQFPSTPEGMQQAIEWAKSQPHSYIKGKTLYEELYDESLDGYMNLHRINEAKNKLNNLK